MKSTVVDESLSSYKPMYCSREYQTSTRLNQQYEKSTLNGVQSKGHIVIPYTQGLCESIKKICGRYGIQTPFKGSRTIKNLLVSPKDKEPMVNQSGAIYRYQCGDLGCDDEYIGETSRTFGERYKEHLKAPLPFIIIVSKLATPLTQITSK